MKKIYLTAIVAVSITGCSSSATVSNVESNAANKIVVYNLQSNASNKQAADLPVNQPNQSNAVAGNTTNANKSGVQDSSISLENLERLKSKGGGDKNAAPIAAVKASPNPAPDNSEISSTMNSKGVPIETRVFKNNPMLLKVEKTFEDPVNPLTKAYLKNGKVLIVPKGALAKPETATGDEILRAVGAKP